MHAIATSHVSRLALALALPWALVGHAQSPAPARVVTPDPRVRPAAGTPCVVHLLASQLFPDENGTFGKQFTYMPPATCRRHGPRSS